MRRLFRQIAVDQQGATIVEFALITPALLLTLMVFALSNDLFCP